MPARLFIVRGRVQGVGFRWWTRETAQHLGLAGTVRNCADGSVEVRAFGDDAALAELRHSLRRGPPASQVRTLDEQEIPDPEPHGFRITD